ncbi:MAG: PH domain-containing protein [Rikenellaceae bacterium]
MISHLAIKSTKIMITSEYKWSIKVKVITTFAIVVLLGFCIFILHIDDVNPSLSSVMTPSVKSAIISIYILIVFIGYIFSPHKLTIDNEALTCYTRINRVRVPLSEILHVKKLDPDMLRGPMFIRFWGSNGFCGYYGTFRNRRIGQYTIYATEHKNLVMVVTRTKKYIFNLNLEESQLRELFAKGE